MKDSYAELMHLGLKATPQRLAILRFVSGTRSHPTAESIREELLTEYPSLSLATVYNTLSRLVERGKVRELDIDPHKKRFDAAMEPHDHFYCRLCGSVYDIASVPNDSADGRHRGASVEGHRVDELAVNLRGVCRNCDPVRSRDDMDKVRLAGSKV